MKFLILFSSLLFFEMHSYTQIVSGKTSDKKKKNKELKKTTPVTPSEDFTLLSLNYAHGNAFRLLKSNGDFYGEDLGEHAKEKLISANGFYFAANSKLNKNIYLDFGLGLQQYGEQYTYQNLDTTISYTTKYSNVVLPLKVHFQTGKKLVFFFNTGIQAQLLSKYFNSNTTKIGEEEEIKETALLKYKNAFSLASTSSIGVSYPFSPKTCIMLSGDFIQQISSTYNKQAPYIHKANFYGFKIGLGCKF